MQLSDVFLSLGEESFGRLIKGISLGKLKSYQLFERFKIRCHFGKLNSETLARAASRLWTRLGEKDDEYARDLAQAILVSHLDMIIAVLDFMKVPHEDGFFAKELDAKAYFTEGWSARVVEEFKGKYPEELLRFYTGHLCWELSVAA